MDVHRTSREAVGTRKMVDAGRATFLKNSPIVPIAWDPYARWCRRGGTARCPPIPINVDFHHGLLAVSPSRRLRGCPGRCYTPSRYLGEPPDVGTQASNRRFGLDLDQIIEPVSADVARLSLPHLVQRPLNTD